MKLIVCCDGTWNTPDQQDGGVAAPTNVVRIANALDRGAGQLVYYHPGVGTGESWWDRMIGGGTGTGLSRNIMSAYEWLCQQYDPQRDDDICLFGFSRGAYTARSVVGFINCAGLLDARSLGREKGTAAVYDAIGQLYHRVYRGKGDLGQIRAAIGEDYFHNRRDDKVPIRFLGVWDTVGALGIPDDLGVLDLLDDPDDHLFHDTELSDNVATARHALAMDEVRKSFQPTLWTNAHPDLKQLWFPGVHSDVGGGYREKGLADGALKWMIDEAKLAGLAFNSGILAQITPDYHDMLHDSCSGLFGMLPTQPRNVPSMRQHPELYHGSARQRHEDPPIHQYPYRQPHVAPGAQATEITVFARQQWNPTGLWLEAGREYVFSATGEWVDGPVPCGPGGGQDGKFHLGELGHVAGDFLGKIETGFQKLLGNPNRRLRFTARHKNFPWFSLVGAVANGRGEVNGVPEAHEAFLIGEGCRFRPQRSGYFYAYSNDAFNCYANNKGYVTLKVSV
ncbi:DUF2235 domain-containing protein [Massilia sp. G4R7]|uniref:DUF2235 domain-containing protein n=1 Tax=Massilia phyllostachyos TaxID=2898585 RepID=A0ABS8QBN1_9BURK|nr:DUF2235 domain-containing protein [Massilia phyllostachyos]MCD2519173.1 DUF2235 domain-containing protein [Massilia phyllostachyos]